jgi:predicted metal-dependent enzyme (double-stranded beta helix superfamily)
MGVSKENVGLKSQVRESYQGQGNLSIYAFLWVFGLWNNFHSIAHWGLVGNREGVVFFVIRIHHLK